MAAKEKEIQNEKLERHREIERQKSDIEERIREEVQQKLEKEMQHRLEREIYEIKKEKDEIQTEDSVSITVMNGHL